MKKYFNLFMMYIEYYAYVHTKKFAVILSALSGSFSANLIVALVFDLNLIGNIICITAALISGIFLFAPSYVLVVGVLNDDIITFKPIPDYMLPYYKVKRISIYAGDAIDTHFVVVFEGTKFLPFKFYWYRLSTRWTYTMVDATTFKSNEDAFKAFFIALDDLKNKGLRENDESTMLENKCIYDSLKE